jgi:hypothetical protein
MEIILRFKTGETYEADIDLAEDHLEMSLPTGMKWPMADGTFREEFRSRMFKRTQDIAKGRVVYREVADKLSIELI